jgi:hypothetical protein
MSYLSRSLLLGLLCVTFVTPVLAEQITKQAPSTREYPHSKEKPNGERPKPPKGEKGNKGERGEKPHRKPKDKSQRERGNKGNKDQNERREKSERKPNGERPKLP